MTECAISDYVFQSNQLSELTLYCDMYGPCRCAGKTKHWSVHEDIAMMKQYSLQSGQKFWHKIKKVLKNRSVHSIRNRGLLLLEYLSSESRYNQLSQLMRVKLFIERIEQMLYNHKEQCKQKIKNIQKDIAQKQKIIEQLKKIRRELKICPFLYDQTIQNLSKCYGINQQVKKQKKSQNNLSVTTSHPYCYAYEGKMQDSIEQMQISQMDNARQSSHCIKENYQFEEEIHNQIIPKVRKWNEYNYNQNQIQLEEQRKQQQKDYSYKYERESQYMPFDQKLSDNELESKKDIIHNPYTQKEQYPVYQKKDKKSKRPGKKQQKAQKRQSKIELEQKIKKQIYKQIIKQKIQTRLEQKDNEQLVNHQAQIKRFKVEDSVNEPSHNYNLTQYGREKQKEQQKKNVISEKRWNGQRLFRAAPNYLQFLKKYQKLHQHGEQDQIYNLSWQQIKEVQIDA